MIVGQEVTERTNSRISFENQPENAVLAQTCIGVFSIHQASGAILHCFIFPNTCGPSGEQPRTTV
jgi:hypothetical protein